MKKIITNLLDVVGTALKIKKKKTEWKMSEDGKEYYDKKKENEFYDALEDGKTKKADAIRKDKQNKINKLKNLIIFIVIFICVSGCKTMTYQPDTLTEAALTTTDRTYEIKEKQPVKTNEGDVLFNKEWVVVHKDFIKQYNENQNDLIDALENKKKIERQKNISFYLLCGTVVVTLLTMLRKAFIKK